jgi:hypothetical protein
MLFCPKIKCAKERFGALGCGGVNGREADWIMEIVWHYVIYLIPYRLGKIAGEVDSLIRGEYFLRLVHGVEVITEVWNV